MSDVYPEWMLLLAGKVAEFEEGHPPLYRMGDPVNYRKAVDGVPAFQEVRGYLIGEVWCLDEILRAIPEDLLTAARYYKLGLEAGKGEQTLQSP